MLRLNVKLSEGLLLRLCATFHTLPLFHLRTYVLRTYALKNYATVEIHNPPQGVLKVGESRFPGSNQIPYPVTFLDFPYRMLVKCQFTGIPFQTRSEALPKTVYPPLGGNIWGRSYLVPAKVWTVKAVKNLDQIPVLLLDLTIQWRSKGKFKPRGDFKPLSYKSAEAEP